MMDQPEGKKTCIQVLRNGRSYRTITPDMLSRVMGFSHETMRKYIGAGFLPSVEYHGKTWVVQPRQSWTILQILKEGHRRADGEPAKVLRSVPYLNSKAVAEILNVSQRRIQKLAAEGYLACVRLNPNGPYRFAVNDIVRYTSRRTRHMTPARAGQARAQLEVLRRLARQRLR